MKVFAVSGPSDVATVYMAEMGKDRMIEFVEALQFPFTRNERWVLMVSTLFGCPVKCEICDAGGKYRGKPTAEEILEQIDYLVYRWFPDGYVPASKFKIQFARMGEPSLNMAVLEVLERLAHRYNAPGLIPSISTVAPYGTNPFFDRLKDIKNQFYTNGHFQFQFSIHTTDIILRDKLIPVRKWSFEQMAAYGERFLQPGDRKITLNFALADGMPVERDVLMRYFNPMNYLIKITPVNPTCQAVKNGHASVINPKLPGAGLEIAAELKEAGYEVIISIGEEKENQIGSNCGQYVLRFLENHMLVKDGYSYTIETL
jgi:23S rRNA (adenine2503-C2)-methyltransferase